MAFDFEFIPGLPRCRLYYHNLFLHTWSLLFQPPFPLVEAQVSLTQIFQLPLFTKKDRKEDQCQI